MSRLKRRVSPPVGVLQHAAARPGGRALRIGEFESGSAQLQRNVWDLDFLRQRPQRAVFGRLDNGLDDILVQEVVLRPPAAAESQEQQSRHRGRAHAGRRVTRPAADQWFTVLRGGVATQAEISLSRNLKGNMTTGSVEVLFFFVTINLQSS